MALPESMEATAIWMPSLKLSHSPAATKAADAFSKTISLFAPFSPFRMCRIMFAFSFASPPTISSRPALLKSYSSGRHLKCAYIVVFQMRNLCRSADADFVKCSLTADHKCLFGSQPFKDKSDLICQALFIDAQHLNGGAGRIGHRGQGD